MNMITRIDLTIPLIINMRLLIVTLNIMFLTAGVSKLKTNRGAFQNGIKPFAPHLKW